MSDFDAKVGRGQQDKKYNRRVELRERKEREEHLVNIAEVKNLEIASNLFRKRSGKK